MEYEADSYGSEKRTWTIDFNAPEGLRTKDCMVFDDFDFEEAVSIKGPRPVLESHPLRRPGVRGLERPGRHPPGPVE